MGRSCNQSPQIYQGQIKVRLQGLRRDLARRNEERKAGPFAYGLYQKIILLNFHKLTEAKEMWMPSKSDLDKVSSPDGDYLVIYRANGNFRAFNYLMELMMEQYSEVTLEGFSDFWGYLKIMMESSTEENDQSDFWYRIVIHMLVERRYPLSKDLLQRMLDLGLEVKRESNVALDLIRFIKKQIDEE
ncbi:hypothetical protein Tco_0347456 [Tanacetum coccineum]